jgi:putative ABC transport system permease protein
MFIGLMFANMILLFGLAMPDIINSYGTNIKQNMFADYQYILKVPAILQSSEKSFSNMIEAYTFTKGIETEEKTSEKFSAFSLKIEDNTLDTVTVYGVKKNSCYVSISDGVYVSSAYADKYHIHKGDVLHLRTEYTDKKYTLKVSGEYNYPGAIAIFMNQKKMNFEYPQTTGQ